MKQIIAVCFILLLFNPAQAQTNKNQSATLIVKGKSISMPGKQIDINTDGFPAMIHTSLNLVTEPVHFHVINAANHKDIKWKSSALNIKTQKPEKLSWVVKNTSDSLTMNVEGTIKPDGKLNYVVKIRALYDVHLDNIRLHLPFTKEATKYMKGLIQKEGLRPDVVDWKWTTAQPIKTDKVWLGDTDSGLQYQLTDHKHRSVPTSWSNQGKGGIHIEQKGKAILADNYSGERHLKKGELLYYNFEMLITDGSEKIINSL